MMIIVAGSTWVYSNMCELLNSDKENDRPHYTIYVQADQGVRKIFDSIEEASEH